MEKNRKGCGKMQVEAIHPFVRQGLIGYLDADGQLFHQKLKTRDGRLFYILEGTGFLCAENKSYPIGPGSVILFQAGTEYIWQIDSMRYIAVNFDYTQEHMHIRQTFSPLHAHLFPPDNFSPRLFFENARELEHPIVLSHAFSFEEKIKSLAIEYHMMGEFSDEMLSAMLKAILLQVLRAHRDPHPAGEKKGAQLARSIIEYIQNHFHEPLNNELIARHFHFHYTYISRIFKAYTGATIHTFLLDYRLNYAMEMLRTQDTPVSQIAKASGFSDFSHFTRLFKERTGQTPSQYRNMTGGME